MSAGAVYHGSLLDYGIIVLYMGIVLGIGFFFSKSDKGSEEFLLGGRRMPWLAIGISCIMSLLSSVSIVVTPGEIYRNGLALGAMGTLLGPFVAIGSFFLFARFYFKIGSFTPYEYLDRRYNPAVGGILAANTLYVRTLYLGTVLFTTAKIFSGAYGWNPLFTIVLVGIIGLVYTVMGGMKAVVWTDVLQFFVLLFGMIAVVIAIACKVDGGVFEVLRYAHANGRAFNKFADPNFYKLTPYIRLSFWLLLLGVFTAQIGNAASDQINIQRLLSTGDWKSGFKAQIVASMSGIPFMLMLWFIGMGCFTFYSKNPDPNLTNADEAFSYFISTQLPAPLPGIFMAAMLAAIMSTLDSGMNSMATVYLKSFHQKYFNKNMTAAQEVRVARIGTVVVGLVAILLGFGLECSERWLAQTAAEVGVLFGLLGSVALPAFLFAVLSRRANATLIWAFTFFSLGEGFASKFWYAASRLAEQKFPETGVLGWGGPLPLKCLLIPLFLGIILLIPYILKKGDKLERYITAALGVTSLGVAELMGVWFFYSHLFITDTPRGCSFAFHLPISLILGFIALRFCKIQPKEKYQGLTLDTLNEKIL